MPLGNHGKEVSYNIHPPHFRASGKIWEANWRISKADVQASRKQVCLAWIFDHRTAAGLCHPRNAEPKTLQYVLAQIQVYFFNVSFYCSLWFWFAEEIEKYGKDIEGLKKQVSCWKKVTGCSRCHWTNVMIADSLMQTMVKGSENVGGISCVVLM